MDCLLVSALYSPVLGFQSSSFSFSVLLDSFDRFSLTSKRAGHILGSDSMS